MEYVIIIIYDVMQQLYIQHNYIFNPVVFSRDYLVYHLAFLEMCGLGCRLREQNKHLMKCEGLMTMLAGLMDKTVKFLLQKLL